MGIKREPLQFVFCNPITPDSRIACARHESINPDSLDQLWIMIPIVKSLAHEIVSIAIITQDEDVYLLDVDQDSRRG